jgi:uncharacterized protein involved in exopolysaccharide biosynthesis
VYVAKALIMVESDEDLARDEFYVNWNIFRKDDARSELQLLKSGPVLNRVIEDQQLTYDDVYHPLTSQLKYFWETSWVGVKYKQAKEAVFPQPENPYVTDGDMDRGKILDDLASSVQIIPIGESNIGEVQMKGPSPRVADVTNAMLETYLATRIDRFSEEAKRALTTLTREEELTRTELIATEQERAAFLNDNDIDFALQSDLNRLEQLATLEVDLVAKREAIAASKAALTEIDRQLESEPTDRIISTIDEINTLRQAAQMQRVSQEIALAAALGRYRDDAPEVTEIRDQIARLDAIIGDDPEYIESGRTTGINAIREDLLARRSGLLATLASTNASFSVINERVDELKARIRILPQIQLGLSGIDRRMGLLQERYQVLALKRAQAEVSLATAESAMPALRVMAPARYPGSKSWPTLKLVLPAALALGLGLGVFAAVIRHHVAGRVRVADLARTHEDIPIIASVRVPTRGRPVMIEPRERAGTANGNGRGNGMN